MTAVTIQSNKIVSNEVKDNQAWLQSSYRKTKWTFGQPNRIFFLREPAVLQLRPFNARIRTSQIIWDHLPYVKKTDYRLQTYKIPSRQHLYRCTLFYCMWLYCASQMCFLPVEDKALREQKDYGSLYGGGLELNPQYWGLPVLVFDWITGDNCLVEWTHTVLRVELCFPKIMLES